MKKRQMYLWTRRVAAGFTAGMLAMGCLSAVAAPGPAPATPSPQVTAPAVAPLYAKPGFYTEVDARDGRLWVFKQDSEDLASYKEKGRPARHVLRPGAGPLGLTLKSTESSTIIEYVASKPGYVVELDSRDERLWVFKQDSEDLASYKEKGRPARHVLRPGAGPLGLTLKSTELETIVDYVVSQPGFYTEVDARDGRLWVFKQDSEDLASYKEKGRPARHVLRPGAGPLGLTLKSTEASVLDEYQARF